VLLLLLLLLLLLHDETNKKDSCQHIGCSSTFFKRLHNFLSSRRPLPLRRTWPSENCAAGVRCTFFKFYLKP
jgi:hypothetical protein